MKKLIIFGIVSLILIMSVTAIKIEETKEIVLTLDVQLDNTNINGPYDDNVYNVYCDDGDSVCHVYMTDERHTILIGD